MEKYGKEFWDKTWSKPYGRYNRHHLEIWSAVFPFIGGKVADLGCGPCVLYKGKDIDLTGVDQSQEALNRAKEEYPNGKYVLADVRHTGLPSEEFDTVILSGVLDYFDDWNDILKEARRITKNEGHIVGTLLNGFNGHDWSEYPRITSNWHLYLWTKGF